MDNNSLSHTKWTCKYHIVFAPKFRRKVIYKQIRADIGHILSELCKKKRCRNNSSRVYARSCSYVCEYTTEVQCIGNNGIFERKEFFDDIR